VKGGSARGKALGKSGGTGAGGTPGRSDESVRKIFDQNKGAVFAIYNRALRKDPSLQGKVTVRLVIEPNGTVSSAKLVSSALNSPALERKLLARIRLINFGAEPVARTTVNYSFDFLPF
jgi:TonB family protein